jgi:hypothetical protein
VPEAELALDVRGRGAPPKLTRSLADLGTAMTRVFVKPAGVRSQAWRPRRESPARAGRIDPERPPLCGRSGSSGVR